MLSCLHNFVRNKSIANFGDWSDGDSILSIIRMVIYRACNDSSCFKNDEVHIKPDQYTISNNILSLLVQDYNNLEIKQRSSFYQHIINQVTNKRKLLSTLGFESELDIKRDGMIGNMTNFELNEPVAVQNILNVSFVSNIGHDLSLEQTSTYRVRSTTYAARTIDENKSHIIPEILFKYFEYLKSYRFQIQLQFKINPLDSHNTDIDKLVGIELSFGGEDAGRFIGLDTVINVPYIKLPDQTSDESNQFPVEHLFTVKFFPLKPLPGLIQVNATFTGIKKLKFEEPIDPSTALCNTSLNNINIRFKDLFLPIFDKDLPEGITKSGLFEAMWDCPDSKMVSSVKVLRQTQVAEVMDSFKLFSVNQKDYIFIFLPPKYHLLIQLTQHEENAHLKIKTDYWQLLAFIDEMFHPIPSTIISSPPRHTDPSEFVKSLSPNANSCPSFSPSED